MAERENIRKRSININPQTAVAGEAIERVLVKHGLTCRATLTEDMTREEEEMAVLEGYIKEGLPLDEADRKAKGNIALMRKVFKY